jgi:hypothetical protein
MDHAMDQSMTTPEKVGGIVIAVIFLAILLARFIH